MEAERSASIDRGFAASPQSQETLTRPTWVVSATWYFIVLGIAVRSVRYLVNYPIWHDEAFLAVNFWDRSFVDLLRPLDYGQIAPWLFLAIERTAVSVRWDIPSWPCGCSRPSVVCSVSYWSGILPVGSGVGRHNFSRWRCLRSRSTRSATVRRSSLMLRICSLH